MSPEREAQLCSLAERLSHRFAELRVLDRALTHASHATEAGGGDNEALELLGDAVLGCLVTDLLHRRDPDGDEGTKSQAKALLVATPSLAQRAERLGLPELLLLGRGEERTGGRAKATLWADAYEAVVAALYLDGGFEATRRFIVDQFAADVTRVAALPLRDAKSKLQELLQGRGDPPPEYLLVSEDGPSHSPRFRVRCVVAGRLVTEGEGTSKKAAQQQAARKALETLGERGAGEASGPGEGAGH